MKVRNLVLIALSGALCASASGQSRPDLVVTFGWTEVYEGTMTPVSNPNGLLEPGESALLRISVSFPPVGTPMEFHQPSPGGQGTLAGFAVFAFSLSSAAAGSWGALDGMWEAYPGAPSGNGLIFAGAVQPWPAPGMLPDPLNPVHDLWMRVWTPDTFEPALAAFQMSTGTAWPELYVVYGTDPSTGDPLVGRGRATPVLDSVQIPVIPSPGGVMCMLGALVLCRRQRPQQH